MTKDELISRQAAIDGKICIQRANGVEIYDDYAVPVEYLKQLPPAQPDIVRCRDCKHWDGVDTCDVIDAPVWDNDFCSMAERRSDE